MRYPTTNIVYRGLEDKGGLTITILDEKKNRWTIDRKDWVLVKDYSWCFDGRYLATTINGKKTRLHSLLMNPPKGKEVDHIDSDPKNNRRSNLRIVTHRQNMQNVQKRRGTKSAYIGVYWDKIQGHWFAQINHQHIGIFKEERHAAMARDIWAKELFGQYAKLNFQTI